MFTRFFKKRIGLTLIELLAVIAIIAILFVLLIPTISSAFDKAKMTGVKVDLRSYETALKSYWFENPGGYFSVEKFNTYLDENLKFTNGVSRKESPFSIPYILMEDSYFVKIYTVENKQLPKEFSIISPFLDEQWIFSDEIIKKGFDEDVIGIPYCESPLENNGLFTFKVCFDSVIISSYLGSSTNLTIPPQIEGKPVIAIERSQFYTSTGFAPNTLNSLNLPNTLKVIGDFSFSFNNLTSIIIPNSVVSVNDGAFYENNLSSVTIPNSVTYLGDYSFFSNKLSSLTIPSSIKTINDSTFSNNRLTSVNIPNSVTKILPDAFSNNRLTSVNIPNSVTKILPYAFLNNRLTSVNIPNSVMIISEGSFGENKLSSLSLPNTVTTIEDYAFYDNSLTSITIPSSVTFVGEKAFFVNPNLKTVINHSSIPNNVLLESFDSNPTITN